MLSKIPILNKSLLSPPRPVLSQVCGSNCVFEGWIRDLILDFGKQMSLLYSQMFYKIWWMNNCIIFFLFIVLRPYSLSALSTVSN